jgi:hypothetical protein
MTRKTPCGPEAQMRKTAQTLSKLALDTLAKLMEKEDGPPTIRLAAAREVLDRGHGRPKLGGQAEGGDADGLTVIVKRYSDVTDEERARANEGEA